MPKHPLTGAERANPGTPEAGPKEIGNQQSWQTQSSRHCHPGNRCAPRIHPSREEGERIQPEKQGIAQGGASPRRNEQQRADLRRPWPPTAAPRHQAGQGFLQQSNRAHETAYTAAHPPRQQKQRQRQQGENADQACRQRGTDSHVWAQSRQHHHRPSGRPLRTARPPEGNSRRKRGPADPPPPGSPKQVSWLGCGHSARAILPFSGQPK